MKSLFCLVLFILGTPVNTTAQTPKQHYFDWTEMPFTKEELAQRRTNLIHEFVKNEKTGVVLIPARDGFSYGETFRQLDDFYYFTGLELPNSLLVINLTNKNASIYTPKDDLRFSRPSRPNDFPGRPLLKDKEITHRSGLELKNITDFSSFMDEQAQKKATVFLNSGQSGDFTFASGDYIDSPSPTQLLGRALKEKNNVLTFENSYQAIAKLRMVKSAAEIELLRKATEINIKGIRTAAKSVQPGIDERYLEGILEGNYKVNGAQRLAFGSIIKSGPNSLWPWRILATHYDRRNRSIENGDLVIFDVGCEYGHYVSDVGRTFPVSGRFSEEQKAILNMEVGIADAIIDFIKPGIRFADIRDLTDRIIPKDAKKYMQVGLFFGHHLGLSTGDPYLPDAPLQAGMVFTVEPWYYNHDKGLSVFTEDVILVTDNGCEVLSKGLPRTPDDLESIMK